jgi:hypothetical protein
MEQRRYDDMVALGAIAVAGPLGASSFMIARALLHGRNSRRVPGHDLERLGFGIAAALVRRGLVVATPRNRFKLADRDDLGRLLPK